MVVDGATRANEVNGCVCWSLGLNDVDYVGGMSFSLHLVSRFSQVIDKTKMMLLSPVVNTKANFPL